MSRIAPWDIPDHHPACVHNPDNDNYECELVGDPARWEVCGECTCSEIWADLKYDRGFNICGKTI